MSIFRRDTVADEADRALREELKDEVAGLRADVRALTNLKDRTTELRQTEDRLEVLKREKGRLDEEATRRERDTQHKVGLLMERQEQDLANAKRETVLDTRTENLAAERALFERQMTFQTERLGQEIERMERMQTALMEHLPSIEAMFTNKTGALPRPVARGKEERADG